MQLATVLVAALISVALAKAHPGQLSYSSSGAGTPAHLAGVMFNQAAPTTPEELSAYVKMELAQYAPISKNPA